MSEKYISKQVQPVFDQIVGLTDDICSQHLNEDYQKLARRMAAKLARKRPSPLLQGKANSWACGIVYALGRVNFLFDPSQTPHMRANELCRLFGVSQSTATARSKAIWDMLRINHFDWHWLLSSRLDDSPIAWMVAVNGYIVDARHMPRVIQEEAFRKGLIPYIPGEKPEPWRSARRDHE